MVYRITSCLLLVLVFSLTAGCRKRSKSGRLRQVWRLETGKWQPQSVRFSSDGRRIALVTDSGAGERSSGDLAPIAGLQIVDADQGVLLAKMEYDNTIRSVHFVAQNTKVLGLFGRQIELRDASTFAVTQSPDRAWFQYCQVLPGEKEVLARSDRALRVVSLESGNRVYTRNIRRAGRLRIALAWTATPDGRFVAEAADQVYVLDRTTSQERMCPTPRHITALALTTDGKTLAEVDLSKCIIRDVSTGQARHSLNVGGHDGDISPDGRMLAISGDKVTLWNISSGVKEDEAPGGGLYGLACAAFSPDSSRLVTAHTGDDKCVLTLWKLGAPQQGLNTLLWGLGLAIALIVAVAALVKRRRAKRVASREIVETV